jgi:hypothetical protein
VVYDGAVKMTPVLDVSALDRSSQEVTSVLYGE